MNRTAYFVVAIDEKTDKVIGCGIFSEESPTVEGRIYLFCPLQMTGNDFEDAVNKIRECLYDTPHRNRYLRNLYERFNNICFI